MSGDSTGVRGRSCLWGGDGEGSSRAPARGGQRGLPACWERGLGTRSVRTQPRRRPRSPLHGRGHQTPPSCLGPRAAGPGRGLARDLLDPGLRRFGPTGRELASPPVGLGRLSQHGLGPCPRSRQSRACGVARTSGPPSPRPRRRPCPRSRSRCRTTGAPPRPAPPPLPCAVRAPGGCASARCSCTLRVSAQDAAHPGPGQPVWGERPAAAGRGPGPRAPSG